MCLVCAFIERALLLSQGGFGVGRRTAREVVDTQLSVAGLTQAAMRKGPSKFRPSVGPNRGRLLLQSLWETLHYAATGLWPEDTRALSFPSSAMCYPRHMQLLAPFSPFWTGSVQLGPLAHKHAADGCSLTIPDAAFTSGMRHCLDLSQMPPGATVPTVDPE
jgi:hypothetical protein